MPASNPSMTPSTQQGATFDAGFSEVASTTYDSSLAVGIVVGTIPERRERAKPTYVEVVENEPTGESCETRTDRPRDSERSDTGMIVRGWVRCTDAPKAVTLTTVLFECSSKPTGKSYASLAGDPNCRSFAGEPTSIVADSPVDYSGFSFATTRVPPVAGDWYIGVTFGTGVGNSVPQLVGFDRGSRGHQRDRCGVGH